MLCRTSFTTIPSREFAQSRLRMAGDYDHFTPGNLEEVMLRIRTATDDANVFPLQVSAGSVVLDLASQLRTRDHLANLAHTGELARLLGRDILSFGEVAHRSTLVARQPEPWSPATQPTRPDYPYLLGLHGFPSDSLPTGFGLRFTNNSDTADEMEMAVHLFFEALSVASDDLWVNLGPAERRRVLGATLDGTELSRVFLECDLALKQTCAGLLSPACTIGREFWAELRRELVVRDGCLPHRFEPHFRLWIKPATEKILVSQTAESGYTVVLQGVGLDLEGEEAHGKYGFFGGTRGGRAATVHDELCWSVFKRVVFPVICQQLNQGQTFARMRQATRAIMLAAWVKQHCGDESIWRARIDQGRLSRVRLQVGHQVHDYDFHAWRRAGDPTSRPRAEIVRAANDQVVEEYHRTFWHGVRYRLDSESADDTALTVVTSFFSGAVDSRSPTFGHGLAPRR